MAFKHPLDPETQWAAAAVAGKLVAQGILSEADILPDLLAAALKGYTGDPSGLRCRLGGRLRECADHWGRERDRAEFLIRRELAPMLDALADGADILRAGHAINERLGGPPQPSNPLALSGPLLRSEVVAIVEGEMIARMTALIRAQQPQRRRRHVR